MKELFIGPVIHCNKSGQLIILNYAEILVVDGKITSIRTDKSKESNSEIKVTLLKPNQFLIPGFIDCHIHPVQFPNMGLGYDKDLLRWLECYTFPLELKFSDNNYAEKVMNAVVKKTLLLGTTTACYFASLYSEASLILAKAAGKFGQRAFVGKVNMNCCRSDNYYETMDDSINNTVKFVKSVFDLKNPLVKPIITPRFVLSCDMGLMKSLANIAKENDIPIQTHISENVEEIKIVKEAFKQYSSYAAIYDAAGLLTEKTVLAHGVYLEDEELELLKERKTSVIHCPSSNTLLKSGMCDVQRITNSGVKVGLGTDISGGPSASIMNEMRSAIQLSIHISFQKPGNIPLTYEDVFYYATLGGATTLSLDDQVGNFEPGKQFDALIIDMDSEEGVLDNLKEYSLRELIQRFIYSGDDRNIIEVFVAGHRVKSPILESK